MSAWGSGGFKSCDSLLRRVEGNDDKLTELVILPMKMFGGAELDRLSYAITSGKNTNLKSISASGHSVPSASLERFGAALSDQSKNESGITHVAIGSKDMGDAGVIALCEGLGECNGGLVQSLDLGWKEIGEDGIKKLGATFAQSKYFLHLDLSRNDKVGCDGISAFCAAAKESVVDNRTPFSTLQQMNLSECNIGAVGVKSLAECLGGRDVGNGDKRIDLSLNHNPIGSKGCESIKDMLARPCMGSILSKLHLSQCVLSDEGLITLSKAAKATACKGLTSLDLSNNLITQVGAQSFAESLLKSWPDLVDLNLSKNNLGSAGVGMIVKVLEQRTDIPNDHPVISNETVLVVKSLLQNVDDGVDEMNSVLKQLDLTESNCGIEGASAALMCGGLLSLRLFNNKLGSDGFYSIAKLLQGGHPSLEHLDLGGNSADEDAVVALLDAIRNVQANKASKLAVLEIGGNSFGGEADASLKRLKKIYPNLDVAHDKPIQNEVIEE